MADLPNSDLCSSVTFPIGRYRITFTRDQPSVAPRFLGSAWRGVLGRALKRLVCITRSPECAKCLIYRSCVYPYIFETPPPHDSEMLRLYPSAPHPYVLGAPLKSSGMSYTLGMSLFGGGNRYLGYVVQALREAGQRGLEGQGKFELVSVSQEETAGSGQFLEILASGETLAPLPVLSPPIPEAPRGGCAIQFATPLRLREDEHYLAPGSLSFGALFSNLLRRISQLRYFHTESPLVTDFARLTAQARPVKWLRTDLRWFDWARFSNRQQRRVPMGGVIGTAELRAEDAAEFWQYLWIGQFTQAGKGASMGLGQYTIAF